MAADAGFAGLDLPGWSPADLLHGSSDSPLSGVGYDVDAGIASSEALVAGARLGAWLLEGKVSDGCSFDTVHAAVISACSRTPMARARAGPAESGTNGSIDASDELVAIQLAGWEAGTEDEALAVMYGADFEAVATAEQEAQQHMDNATAHNNGTLPGNYTPLEFPDFNGTLPAIVLDATESSDAEHDVLRFHWELVSYAAPDESFVPDGSIGLDPAVLPDSTKAVADDASVLDVLVVPPNGASYVHESLLVGINGTMRTPTDGEVLQGLLSIIGFADGEDDIDQGQGVPVTGSTSEIPTSILMLVEDELAPLAIAIAGGNASRQLVRPTHVGTYVFSVSADDGCSGSVDSVAVQVTCDAPPSIRFLNASTESGLGFGQGATRVIDLAWMGPAQAFGSRDIEVEVADNQTGTTHLRWRSAEGRAFAGAGSDLAEGLDGSFV